MSLDPSTLGIGGLVLWFAVAALTIGLAGTAIARLADVIADRTGLGEAIIGAVLLGGATSLSGIVTSVTAAWQGHPSLAISNAVGGIAIQTAFLAVADLTYRKANLEHAAASLGNVSQAALLVILLGVPLAALFGPNVAAWGVHPASLVIVVVYLGGLRLLGQARRRPMWFPRSTTQTVADVAQPEGTTATLSNARLYLGFALLAGVLVVAGYAVSQLGLAIADATGLAQTTVGGLLTAGVTSLPELVTTIAAVHRGALTLAVGGLIGGNAFDMLFLALSDVAYREGSIYHRFNVQEAFVVAMTIMMTGTLLLGLLRRQRHGVARIGFESALILVFYALVVAVIL